MSLSCVSLVVRLFIVSVRELRVHGSALRGGFCSWVCCTGTRNHFSSSGGRCLTLGHAGLSSPHTTYSTVYLCTAMSLTVRVYDSHMLTSTTLSRSPPTAGRTGVTMFSPTVRDPSSNSHSTTPLARSLLSTAGTYTVHFSFTAATVVISSAPSVTKT
ncbi:hypothetical protein K501DRAFT_279179 [Backusella circina FSU 941]|nr:hypothetical protein K501DRAFT_279179 [Backusella circina FSU 941]